MSVSIYKAKRTYSVPAVDRTLDIVEFMADQTKPLGINELARELHIPVNSVFRILKRLTERGYTEMAGENGSGGYQLSTRFFSLGTRLHARFDLRNRARVHLERLAIHSGETCQIHVLKDKGMLVLDVANPASDFFLQIVPGAYLNFHSNAFGKAVMAFMPEKEVKKIIKPQMPRLTANTITDRTRLFDELSTIRETGLSYDREEYTTGIYCIGSVVFDVNGLPVAGLGITGLSVRSDGVDWSEFEKDVLNCAMAIARDIGYTGDIYERWLSGRREKRS